VIAVPIFTMLDGKK